MKKVVSRYLAALAVLALAGAASVPAVAQTNTQNPPLYNSTGGGKTAPVFIGEGDMAGKSQKSTTGLTGLLDRKPYKLQTKSVAVQELNNVEEARRIKAEQEKKNAANRAVRAKRQAEIRSQYAAVAAENEKIKAASEAPLRAADLAAADKAGKLPGVGPAVAPPAVEEKEDPYAGKTVVLRTRPAEPGEKKPVRLFNVRDR